MNKLVGVLGGLGPMATVYFYKMIVEMTDANSDQEHVDMVIINKATTPDRTAYILGESNENPTIDLVKNAKNIELVGADVLVIPCNTAHYFYDEIKSSIDIPIINMPKETVYHIKKSGYRKIGILATDGTIKGKIYQNICIDYDIDYEILDEVNQSRLMGIIYNDLKMGKKADMKKFNQIVAYFEKLQCDCVIIGCTELSILKNDNKLNSNFYIDSMSILARKVIEFAGKNIKNIN